MAVAPAPARQPGEATHPIHELQREIGNNAVTQLVVQRDRKGKKDKDKSAKKARFTSSLTDHVLGHYVFTPGVHAGSRLLGLSYPKSNRDERSVQVLISAKDGTNRITFTQHGPIEDKAEWMLQSGNMGQEVPASEFITRSLSMVFTHGSSEASAQGGRFVADNVLADAHAYAAWRAKHPDAE